MDIFISTDSKNGGKQFLASVDMDEIADCGNAGYFCADKNCFAWSADTAGAIHFVVDDAPEAIFDLFAFKADLEAHYGNYVAKLEQATSTHGNLCWVYVAVDYRYPNIAKHSLLDSEHSLESAIAHFESWVDSL